MTASPVVSRSEQETVNLGRAFGEKLRRGDVVALMGDLGTGKTRFVKGVCEAFGVRSPVSSPTFVLVNRYEGRNPEGKEMLIHHLDCYRVKSLEEVYDLGFEELFSGDAVCLIEWADMILPLLPDKHYDVRLSFGTEEHERVIAIQKLQKPAGTAGRLQAKAS
ncbi:MAG: tRNA (adenosine(37)-N6)-threonylcarbamoyltransferase complex ATPase subunit type 1 TsaE [Bacteroidota bacterium]